MMDAPGVSAETSMAGTYPTVDRDRLAALVDEMKSDGDFLILHRSDRENEVYAQVCVTPAPAKPGGRYTLEYRDGPDSHWQAFTDDDGVVTQVLSGWAFGGPSWKELASWSRLNLGF